MAETRIDCLDKGYVRLVDHMGSDLSVVNAARVSYDKESTKLSIKDERLIQYLAKHGHTSPFRHATVELEIRAPLMVARQWFKYRVGSHHMDQSCDDAGFDDPLYARNESSRRYVTEDPEFYVPEQWLSSNGKQGSGEAVSDQRTWTNKLYNLHELSIHLYQEAIAIGITPEQARLFLPAYGLYIRWRWTASLLGVIHFLKQRLGEDAQSEIRTYAQTVYTIVQDLFPCSVTALIQNPCLTTQPSTS
jgi:thymidylate synthase (FAD)